MFYYRYRTFSELSIKELLYSEIFLASTDECNDPYDSKAFYEFTANKLYWENLVKLIASKIKNVTIGERDVKRIAEKISATCPITYDEALKTDISGICGQVLSDSSLCRCFATCFNDILRLYKPEQSYFASFSKTDNDPLMWSHYASQHQGYCLVFKPINGELRQYHPLKKSSIRRQTPNGLATNSSYGLPESFKFQEIVYKDDVSPLCGFHRLR